MTLKKEGKILWVRKKKKQKKYPIEKGYEIK